MGVEQGPTGQLRHEGVAIVLPYPAMNSSPKIHRNALNVRAELLAVTLQLQMIFYLRLVLARLVLEALDLFEQSVAVQKHRHYFSAGLLVNPHSAILTV